MKRIAPLLVVLAASAATPALAQGPRVVVHQQLALMLNPMGAQHQLEVGLRSPLGDQDELLFGGAHAEAGVISRVAPVFAIQGGYLQVSPLSFLVLRAEFNSIALWPIGMDGAGYYGVDGYDDENVSPQDFSGEAGENATGWSVRLQGQLQGAIPMGDARLLLANRMTFQHDTLGDAEHYYSVEHDLILARSDWVMHNDALVLAEIPCETNLTFRGGAYSNLRWVPESGHVAHQVGALTALTFSDVIPEVSSITLFLRGGYYTHHLTRADEMTVLGGVSIDYELGAIQ